jgi:hypothetical protein
MLKYDSIVFNFDVGLHIGLGGSIEGDWVGDSSSGGRWWWGVGDHVVDAPG